MNDTRSFYSVVQYVPDAGRAEAANIGVVLCVPALNRIELRASPTLERVRKFFSPGKPQLHRINEAVKSLESRFDLQKKELCKEDEFELA